VYRFGWSLDGKLRAILLLKDLGSGWPGVVREVSDSSGQVLQRVGFGSGFEEELGTGWGRWDPTSEFPVFEPISSTERYMVTWGADLSDDFKPEVIDFHELILPVPIDGWRASCLALGSTTPATKDRS
jgi:hypothetical protein